PITSPQWTTTSAPAAAASLTARASASARSWLSETMQIFMNPFRSHAGDVLPISGTRIQPRVPLLGMRQLRALARQAEPAMRGIAERDVGHRQRITGDEWMRSKLRIENAPHRNGLLHRAVHFAHRNLIGW